MGLREWVIPQDKVFFELLTRLSQKVDLASEAFVEMMEDFSDIKEKNKRIKELEHEADGIVHDIYYRLNETLIAPLDHEDISRLAKHYDDVIDHIFGTANRLEIYEIKKPTKAMKRYAKIIREQVRHINRAVEGIQGMKKEEMERSCVEIHRLENEADRLLYAEISALFKTKDPVEIIKLKEIYENMERVTDLCEDVGNALLDIRMKYS